MFERFRSDVRAAVTRAIEEEAPALGSRSVEAEHLLLALTISPGPAGRLLAEAGLDHEALRAALKLETERSLVAVGVDVGELGLPALPARTDRAPKMGASAKRALERAAQGAIARKDRHISATHLLVGILRAEFGTLPRALAEAEQDRVALLSKADAMLG